MDALVISDQVITVDSVRTALHAVDSSLMVFDAPHMASGMGMLCGEHRIALIVLDLDSRGSRPLMNAALLRDMWPDIPLVVMTSRERDAINVRAAQLGVEACIVKGAGEGASRDAFSALLRAQSCSV